MSSRTLPKKVNPLIVPDVCPPYDELLARRRFGKANLAVKPGQVGTSNATKPENLGMLEFVHLRAPLPKELKGTEIFPTSGGSGPPESYFLIRRSKDGYVSATGMFKIAFPWAKDSQEKAEREYLRSKDATSRDETAGNLWISPELALDLAGEYHMYDWVRALLDPEEISQSPTSAKKHISPPPKFDLPPVKSALATPASTPKSRGRRSASPVKGSARKIASPKKRITKAMKEANAASAAAASETLQAALDTAVSDATANKVTTTEGSDDKVKIEVESAVKTENGVEVTTTNVSVELPAGSPELPLPEDTEKMLETAKRMVEEAQRLDEDAVANTGKISKKRKAESSAEDGTDGATPAQPAKKAKMLEEKLKREKVRNRALIGVTATLAIAAAIPYFF